MSAVLCAAASHGSGPHKERPDCLYPHYVHPSGPLPSMSAVETLDPREAVPTPTPTEPTPENRGLLPAGFIVDGSPIERRSATAYLLADGRWVSFDRVHGRPALVEPLVQLNPFNG